MVQRQASTEKEAPDMANLRRIGLTYYVRFIIPKDRWQDFDGKREVVRTLQTRDLKEARRRRAKALAAIHGELNGALAGRGLKPLDSEWVPDWQTAALEDNAELRNADSKDGYLEPDDTYNPSTREMWEYRILENAERLEDRHGPAVAKSYYRTAMGDSTPIGLLADRWLKAEASRLAAQTVGHHRYAVNLLGTYLGLSAAGRNPRDAAQILQSIGMETLNQDIASGFIEWVEQDQKKHPSTCARLHSSLSAFWKWAATRKMVPENIWAGLAAGFKRKAQRKANKEGLAKRPYSASELVALLTADPNAGRKWSYGPALFDLLRLGLLTGARANELCSLRRRDITRNGTGIRIDPAVSKTDNAVREIPLHALAQAIIAARIQALPNTTDPDAILFPELPLGGPDKKRSWKFSSRFSGWRQSVLGPSSEVDFHSLRRCFASHWEMAQAAGASACTELARKDLMGHARRDVTAGYVQKDLGWETYSRAINAMVAEGIPAEVLEALRATSLNRPSPSRRQSRSVRPARTV